MISEPTNSNCQKKYNRRDFMKKSSATVGLVIISNSSLVQGSRANSKIEVGCVGLGGRGRLIAKMLNEHGGYQITSIADYFPEVTKEVGEELGIDKKRQFWGLSGYKKLIDSKVDAVFLETPPFCFPDHVTEAVNAGYHVYIAKPLGCDVPGCLKIKEMANIARKKNLVFLCDFQTRTEPLFIEAIKRVQQGDIGQLGMLLVKCCNEGFKDYPKTNTIESRLRNLVWVNDIDLGGGYIVNYDIHAVDVALWIANSTPISAQGSSRISDPKAYGDSKRYYSITYEFKDGLLINHYGEHTRNVHNIGINCNAYGSQGHLETKYAGKVWIRSNKRPYPGGECTALYQDGIKRNLETFYNSIKNGIYDNPTVQPSVNATLATILGREATARSTKMTWNEVLQENRKLEVDYSGMIS